MIDYATDVWSGYEGSKYKIEETDGFDKEITHSNNIESFHNKFAAKVGIHSSYWKFADGVVDLVFEYCIEWAQFKKHGTLTPRRQYYIQRDRKRQLIFDSIKQEMAANNNDYSKITMKFWIEKLQQMRNVMYPSSKKVSKDKGLIDNPADLILSTLGESDASAN